MTSTYNHEVGAPVECLSIPIELNKEQIVQPDGSSSFRCGLRIGGGIDQDSSKSPFNYKDNGIYITHIENDGPAHKAGLKQHDKILQVNGHDLTMVTHEKAIKYIQRYPTLKLLISRSGLVK